MTQKEALDLLKMGHTVYLTGAAGSGKTFLLNQYIAYLREHAIPVGITASTGIAATHLGGVTIHSWSGMGIHESLSRDEILQLTKRPYLRSRFMKTKVLIIDEISMLHDIRLDLVDHILKVFRNSSQPFGGLQVIFCGDFFQLPPVTRTRHPEPNLEFRNGKIPNPSEMTSSIQYDNTEHFVTESRIWNEINLTICYLDEQYRQEDRAFLRVLNDIRDNEVNETTVEYLSNRLNKDPDGYTKPNRLFTHNADVDAMNLKYLAELSGESHEYLMTHSGNYAVSEVLQKSCLAPQQLVLKKGAQVMFVKNNYEAGYVNGTLGEVIDFDENEVPLVRTFKGSEIWVGPATWEVKDTALAHTENSTIATIKQLPLRLAWAITVHKSQGMSLDAAEVDLSRSFTPGMGYVALSRVRSLSGLKLMGMNQMALSVNERVSEMDKRFRESSDQVVLALQQMSKDSIAMKQSDFLSFLKDKGI